MNLLTFYLYLCKLNVYIEQCPNQAIEHTYYFMYKSQCLHSMYLRMLFQRTEFARASL